MMTPRVQKVHPPEIEAVKQGTCVVLKSVDRTGSIATQEQEGRCVCSVT
jgi:hypothetical protein